MNRQLASWFRSGAQERMKFLSNAEERLTTTTQRIVSQPKMDNLAVTTAAADELLAASKEGLQWLTQHRCPVDRVGRPLHAAFDQFRLAAEALIRMRSGVLPMTAASGQIAADAVAEARRMLYETATAFAQEIAR